MAQVLNNKDIKNHKHIIICGDNQNSLSVVRQLGVIGLNPIVIMLKEYHIPVLAKSKYIGKLIVTENENETYSILMSYADANIKPFVYTTDDGHQSMLDVHYDELKDFFYFYNAGSAGIVSKYMDKNNICSLSKECGIKTPKTEIIRKGDLPKTLKYPVYIKAINPNAAGWKRDFGVFYSEQELIESSKTFIGKQHLAQEYVKKNREFSIHGVSIDAGHKIYMPYVNWYYHNSDNTFGGYCCCELFADEGLKSKLTKLIQRIGYNGIFCIDFIEDTENQPVFLEVNFRTGASNYSLCFGGANLPYIWASSVLMQTLNTSDIVLKSKFFIMNASSDFHSIKRVGLTKWIKQLINADCHYLWNKNDMKPFLSFWYYKVKNYIKKIYR